MTSPITIAGHAAATKVGGRRMSLSKSPGASKGPLAGSPPNNATPLKPGHGQGQTEPAATTDDKDKDKDKPAPTGDSYPRPHDKEAHPDNTVGGDEGKKEREKDSHKEKEKEKNHAGGGGGKHAYEQIKQTIPKKNQQINSGKNMSIQQPSKVMG